MKKILTIALLLIALTSQAQISDELTQDTIDLWIVPGCTKCITAAKMLSILTHLNDNKLHKDSLDIYAASIADTSQWSRDNIKGVIYPKNLTDYVGIGTDSPAQLLDVNGSAYIDDDLYINDTTTAYGRLIVKNGIGSSYGSWNELSNTSTLAVNTVSYKAIDFIPASWDYSESLNIGTPTDSSIVITEPGTYKIDATFTASLGTAARWHYVKCMVNDLTNIAYLYFVMGTNGTTYSISTIYTFADNDYIEFQHKNVSDAQTLTLNSVNITITRIR